MDRPTLTLYPNAYGIGYVVSITPHEIDDFGKCVVDKTEISYFLAKVEYMLDHYNPNVVILRDYMAPNSPLSEKYKEIWAGIEELVDTMGLEIFRYTREDVRIVFEQFQVYTKYEISRKLQKWYPQLRSRNPHKRKAWLAEHNQMSVYDAFSLMVTHYYREFKL